jgi:group I intron endonuclease
MDFYFNDTPAKRTHYVGIGGIYKIVNVVNGKAYLGRTESLGRRFYEHRHGLLSGKLQHKDSVLRRAWLKYGQQNFRFVVVEIVSEQDKAMLPALEQKYLDALKTWKPSVGYNIDRCSTGFTSKTGKSAIAKQITSGLCFSGEGNRNSRLTKEQVVSIRKRYIEKRESSGKLAAEYGVSRKMVCEIINGNYWKTAAGSIRSSDLPQRSHMALREDTRLEIARLYVSGGVTYEQLASQFCCTRNMVKSSIRRYRQSL